IRVESGLGWQAHVNEKRAVRIIHGAPPTTHCKPLFIKLGILTLPSMSWRWPESYLRTEHEHKRSGHMEAVDQPKYRLVMDGKRSGSGETHKTR
ncbi:hypothetical protein C0J52_14773, partial [Blattella germanica]